MTQFSPDLVLGVGKIGEELPVSGWDQTCQPQLDKGLQFHFRVAANPDCVPLSDGCHVYSH